MRRHALHAVRAGATVEACSFFECGRLRPETMASKLKALNDWVDDVARLTRPDSIRWCDGSEAEANALVPLSGREIECLSWVSAGKTSIEISGILGLSEYTVNHYLNRATRKLEAVNRVQAVAKAIRAGLLT